MTVLVLFSDCLAMNASHSAVSAQFVSQRQPVHAATIACLFNKSLDCTTAKILDRVLIRECDAIIGRRTGQHHAAKCQTMWSRQWMHSKECICTIDVNLCTCGFHYDKCNVQAKSIFYINWEIKEEKISISFQIISSIKYIYFDYDSYLQN